MSDREDGRANIPGEAAAIYHGEHMSNTGEQVIAKMKRYRLSQ